MYLTTSEVESSRLIVACIVSVQFIGLQISDPQSNNVREALKDADIAIYTQGAPISLIFLDRLCLTCVQSPTGIYPLSIVIFHLDFL